MLLNMMKRNDAVYTFPVKKKNRFDRSLYSTIQCFRILSKQFKE
jgi:hypothetical protein